VPLPRDVIADRPKILFVGINPGIVSGTVGHHFAGKGNPFYQLLYAAALTPLELVAEQDQQLAGLGYGLINLCRRATKEASELTKEELARGKTRVLRQIKAMKPEIVALVGVTLYPIVCKQGRGHKLEPGPGAKPDVLSGAKVFVLPNPSGLNISYPTFDAKLVWFRKLKRFVDQVEASPAIST
jgi:TDG/mug DNA glycosylase family protein